MSVRYGAVCSFEDVFPNPNDLIAGTKAVGRVMTSRFLCFAKGHAKSVATLARAKPWVLTVGSQEAEDPAWIGRILNVARLSQTYGSTSTFTQNPDEARFYSRWPESVAAHDVYDFVDPPHVIEDLRLSFHPNDNAYGNVMPHEGSRRSIFEALHGHKLQLSDIPSLPHFRDPGTLRPVSSMLPTRVTAEEGRILSREVRTFERVSSVAAAAKENNRIKNEGTYVCEGCAFSHADITLFDAHHTTPLSHGQRQTTPSCLAVLCPTCHRAVHRWGEEAHRPLPIAKLRECWANQRTDTMVRVVRTSVAEERSRV